MSTAFTPEQIQHLYRKRHLQDARRRLWRNNHNCRYCGERILRQKLATVEHVVPRSRGGDDSPQNLTVICRPCNLMKNNRTLFEWRDHLRQQVAQVERFIESRALIFERMT